METLTNGECMSKKQLIEVFGGFSETTLVDMIMAKIRELFFTGDWGSANAIIEYILANVDDVGLQSRAAGFGVFAAVRARDYGLAFTRLGCLVDLPECAGKSEAVIGSLKHLEDMLLPEQAELLARFWLQVESLDKNSREKYAKLGLSLWRKCRGNPLLGQEIMDVLQKNLPVGLFNREGGKKGG